MEEIALRRRARDVLKAAANAGGEQVNVDRRSTEPPELQYVFGQYVLLFVRTEDAGLKQVHPEQPRRCRVWKWRPHKEGEPAGEYLLLDDVENAIGSATPDLLCPNTDLVPKPPESELARMVSWEDIPGWSMTGVRQLWKDVNRVADSKARIQQLKFVVDDTLHRELREKDGHSYVNFWAFLRERAGESQGGRLHDIDMGRPTISANKGAEGAVNMKKPCICMNEGALPCFSRARVCVFVCLLMRACVWLCLMWCSAPAPFVCSPCRHPLSVPCACTAGFGLSLPGGPMPRPP